MCDKERERGRQFRTREQGGGVRRLKKVSLAPPPLSLPRVGHRRARMVAAAELPDESHAWRLIGDFLKQHGMVHHQLESYNHFVETMLSHIIMENSDITTVAADGKTSYHLHFCNVTTMRPATKESDGFERPILPHVARLRGLTYASSVACDLVHDKVDQTVDPPKLVHRKIYREVVLCRLPVMLGSNLCYLSETEERKSECGYDAGGYFLINGNEKCLLAQEKVRRRCAIPAPCLAAPRSARGLASLTPRRRGAPVRLANRSCVRISPTCSPAKGRATRTSARCARVTSSRYARAPTPQPHPASRPPPRAATAGDAGPLRAPDGVRACARRLV